MSNYVLLTFDVEEFDIPLEYTQQISMDEQMEVGRIGLENLLPVLNYTHLNCTLFTTANYALNFPHTTKQLSQQHEIASHTFYHSSYQTEHLLQSKLTLEEITGKSVTGLRMPRMKKVDMLEVANAGYTYDSSVNPTIIPGRYNNLHLPRTKYIEDGIMRIPASVSPKIRLPLFWLAFKNYPYKLFLNLCMQCIKKDGYVCLYFHPWEFADIKKYNLPSYVKNPCGDVLLKKLIRLISDLKNECEFISIQKFLSGDAILPVTADKF